MLWFFLRLVGAQRVLALGFWDMLAATGASIFSGVSNLITSANANETNERLADKAMAFGQASADKQMAFQREMASTQYQRGMADMKKAGLNPIMAYTNGGAAAPPGASTGGVSAKAEAAPVGEAIQQTLGTALTVAKMRKEFEQADASIKATESNARLNDASTVRQKIEAEVAEKTKKLVDANAKSAGARARVDEAAVPARVQEAANEKKGADVDKDLVTFDKYLQRVSGVVGAASNAFNAVTNPLTHVRKWLSDRPKNAKEKAAYETGREYRAYTRGRKGE